MYTRSIMLVTCGLSVKGTLLKSIKCIIWRLLQFHIIQTSLENIDSRPGAYGFWCFVLVKLSTIGEFTRYIYPHYSWLLHCSEAIMKNMGKYTAWSYSSKCSTWQFLRKVDLCLTTADTIKSHWRHSVWNHLKRVCLFHINFRPTSKKT